jgi:hypothetical protein
MKKTIVIILIVLIPCIFLVSGFVTNSVLSPGMGSGYIWIGCIILPLSVAYSVFKLRIKPENVKNITFFSGVISLGYLAFALLFKGLRLPGGDFFIILGVSVFAIFFLPFLFRTLLLKE